MEDFVISPWSCITPGNGAYGLRQSHSIDERLLTIGCKSTATIVAFSSDDLSSLTGHERDLMTGMLEPT